MEGVRVRGVDGALLSAIKTLAYNETLGPLCWLNYGCIYNRTHTIQRILAKADIQRCDEDAQSIRGQGGAAEELPAHLGERCGRQKLVQTQLIQQQLQQLRLVVASATLRIRTITPAASLASNRNGGLLKCCKYATGASSDTLANLSL